MHVTFSIKRNRRQNLHFTVISSAGQQAGLWYAIEVSSSWHTRAAGGGKSSPLCKPFRPTLSVKAIFPRQPYRCVIRSVEARRFRAISFRQTASIRSRKILDRGAFPPPSAGLALPNNFAAVNPLPQNTNQYSVRLDHRLSQSNSLFGHYAHAQDALLVPCASAGQTSCVPGFAHNDITRAHSLSLTDTQNLVFCGLQRSRNH